MKEEKEKSENLLIKNLEKALEVLQQGL